MKIARKLITTLVLAITATVFLGAQEYGVASYYSDKFQGKPTASGELYDKDKYTAAHKSYPFGTIIKVTRLDNKKSVKVRVIDRGPYVNGRIVDLSRRAAESLDLIDDGTARVKVEVVDQASEPSTEPAAPVVTVPTPTPPSNPITQPETSITETPPAITVQPGPPITEVPEPPSNPVTAPQPVIDTPTVPEPSSTPPNLPKATHVKTELLTPQNYDKYGLFKIEVEKPAQQGYAVQVASMTNYDNVMRQVAELQGQWFSNILLSVERGTNGQTTYKILLGPFDNAESATAYKAGVKQKTGIAGFVVNLAEINY